MQQPRYQGSLLLVPRSEKSLGRRFILQRVADEAACLEKTTQSLYGKPIEC